MATGLEPARALIDAVVDDARVVVLGLQDLDAAPWAVLVEAGIELVPVRDVDAAVAALRHPDAHVVIAAAEHGRALTAAVRGLRSAHIVLCAALNSPEELRAALDAGADDVMRVPFEPEVLAARVAAGLRAARLRQTRRSCARSWPTSRARSTAVRAIATGRCSG
jgi:DNA-binding response OmpR family regulator